MKTLSLLLLSLFILQARAQDKPNILVLMFEDTSVDYLSAFGNAVIKTPHFDQLAKDGILFTNAYSNAPQCSPARSTFIRGMYATSVGAEWHRMDVMTPDDFYFPLQLQKEGYRTYLKGKHDFNTNQNHWKNELKIFDGTDYTKCPANVPFYGQYNFFDTHMSRITDTRAPGQRDDRTVFASDVDSIYAYIPPTKWVVDDHAYHLHKIKLFDQWLKEELDKLEATGRANNTIIFVTSDHGGCLPGSKGYIREAGVEVPLIAYYPPKWASLAPQHTDGVCHEIVEFADFGPTICSLAGINKPEHMQGRIFCGTERETPKKYAYLYKANQAPNFIPARGITNGKYKIIWNYNTIFPSGARQDFQWKMPGYRDWEAHWRKGEYSGIHSYFFEPMAPIEFYDLNADPEETINLANDAAYADLVEEHKTLLKERVRSTGDLGFFPQSIRDEVFTKRAIYDLVRETNFDMEAVYEAAELASMAEAKDLNQIIELLKKPEAVMRYWGAVGMLRLRYYNKIEELPSVVKATAHNTGENIEVRCLSHLTLLANKEYCECATFLANHLSNEFCKGIIPNAGNLLKPIAANLYSENMNINFYSKSALINAGVLPYEELIDHPNLSIDTTLLFNADTLNCTNNSCEALLIDDFSEANDINLWVESPTTDMVTINDGRLDVLFHKVKPNTSVQRSFSPLDDYVEVSFTYNSDNGTSRTYFSLLNEHGKVLAAVLPGTLEQANGCFVIYDLHDSDGKVDKANIKSKVNFAPGVFLKNVNLKITFNVNIDEQTFSVALNDIESESYPLIQPATSMAAFNVYVEKMYNNNEAAHIDNFSIVNLTTEKVELASLFQEAQNILFSAEIRTMNEAWHNEWTSLFEAFLSAVHVLNNCASSVPELINAKSTLYVAFTKYQKTLASDIASSPSVVTENILPSVFYTGSATYKPLLAEGISHYQFDIYNIKGIKVFSSQNQNRGWRGSIALSPLHIWRLQYQSADKRNISLSGKVMVFVD